MKAVVIIVLAAIFLFAGYVVYGAWLAKKWGIDPTRKTPAIKLKDGVDYVPAKPGVLMGHHFSSIAGAGPINGPIQAAVFGWLPVFLWCVLGSIFIGGVHDFGALFASIRNDGKSLGEIIKTTMGERTKKLFLVFSLFLVVLAIASFVNVVSNTLASMSNRIGVVTSPDANESTAIITLGFILIALIYGFLTNNLNLNYKLATVICLVLVGLLIAFGMNVGIAMNGSFWIVFIGIYICIAALIPVWILLQPRDYLSSFLLYALMGVAVIGVFVSAFSGNVTFDMPAFTSIKPKEGYYLFPTLFTTVACGACSGFHALVATGTTSKQLSNERDAKKIGYGAMLVEAFLAIISLIAAGMVFSGFMNDEFSAPSVVFATGIGLMYGTEGSAVYNIIYSLLILAVSVFVLTSLDTCARLGRYILSELFLNEGEKTYKDAKNPVRKFFANPVVSTVLIVGVSGTIGSLKLSVIWGMFGSANQLLAGIALMAICSWLGNIGKNNKMFYIPMGFMLVTALINLVVIVVGKLNNIISGASGWGDYFQIIVSLAMIVLVGILVKESVKVLTDGRKGKR